MASPVPHSPRASSDTASPTSFASERPTDSPSKTLGPAFRGCTMGTRVSFRPLASLLDVATEMKVSNVMINGCTFLWPEGIAFRAERMLAGSEKFAHLATFRLLFNGVVLKDLSSQDYLAQNCKQVTVIPEGKYCKIVEVDLNGNVRPEYYVNPGSALRFPYKPRMLSADEIRAKMDQATKLVFSSDGFVPRLAAVSPEGLVVCNENRAYFATPDGVLKHLSNAKCSLVIGQPQSSMSVKIGDLSSLLFRYSTRSNRYTILDGRAHEVLIPGRESQAWATAPTPGVEQQFPVQRSGATLVGDQKRPRTG